MWNNVCKWFDSESTRGELLVKQRLSTIFVSHGAPSLPFEDVPARNFLTDLGSKYGNFDAVLCISAHWETTRPVLNAVEVNETIHDFYGFAPELYQIEYPAEGSPELAKHTQNLINDAGISCDLDFSRGLDHGAWIPMLLMYPDRNIPIFQLSIQQGLDPKHHLELGRALEPLSDERVLIVGSGGAVHPLGYASLHPDAITDDWAIKFNEWLKTAVNRGDVESLVSYRDRSPYSERAHPYPDHFMPLLTAMGAAGEEATGKLIHDSWYWGDLGMGAYEFSF